MKNQIRADMLRKRSNLTQEECLSNSKIIIEKLVKILNNNEYKNILIYMDMQNEVMATLLLNYDFNIFITKTMPDNTLLINEYHKNELIKHKFGYYESNSLNYVDGNMIDVIVIPGVAFDLSGDRIGFGKGYYDRLLAKYPNKTRIAICHDFQIINQKIDTDKFDQKMNIIISEKQTINI